MTRLPFRGFVVGRLIVTTCRQPVGAPLVDRGWTIDTEGCRYGSLTLLLRGWRRNVYGERAGGRGLVIGWRES